MISSAQGLPFLNFLSSQVFDSGCLGLTVSELPKLL